MFNLKYLLFKHGKLNSTNEVGFWKKEKYNMVLPQNVTFQETQQIFYLSAKNQHNVDCNKN